MVGNDTVGRWDYLGYDERMCPKDVGKWEPRFVGFHKECIDGKWVDVPIWRKLWISNIIMVPCIGDSICERLKKAMKMTLAAAQDVLNNDRGLSDIVNDLRRQRAAITVFGDLISLGTSALCREASQVAVRKATQYSVRGLTRKLAPAALKATAKRRGAYGTGRIARKLKKRISKVIAQGAERERVAGQRGTIETGIATAGTAGFQREVADRSGGNIYLDAFGGGDDTINMITNQGTSEGVFDRMMQRYHQLSLEYNAKCR